MADSGYVSFTEITSTSNNARISGKIHWEKTSSGAKFYAALTKAESRADNNSKWVGNNTGQMRLSVDGAWTAKVNAVGARTTGGGASGSGWRINTDFAGAETEKVSAAAKSSSYELIVELSGNGTKTETHSVTIQFNIPLFVNSAGTVYQVEKAYANVSGVGVKEVAVYANVGGEIKEFI